MEIKKNNATNNRPEGDRIIDAPVVRVNIPDSINQIKSEKAWLNSDRNALTLLHSGPLRLVLVALKEGAEMSPHSVEGASFIQIISGRVWVETLEKSLSLDTGEGLAIAPDIPRSIFSEEESVLLLTLTSDDHLFQSGF